MQDRLRRVCVYNIPMNTDTKPTTPRVDRGIYAVELGPELKEAWLKWCKEKGVKHGNAAKSMLQAVLDGSLDLAISTPLEGNATPLKLKLQPVAEDDAKKTEVRMSLTPSELEAVKAAAIAQGLDYQDWLVGAVRGALANAPMFGQMELRELVTSNKELASIGLSLVSRKSDITDAELRRTIEALQSDIRKHVETVSKTMAQGARRWRIGQ